MTWGAGVLEPTSPTPLPKGLGLGRAEVSLSQSVNGLMVEVRLIRSLGCSRQSARSGRQIRKRWAIKYKYNSGWVRRSQERNIIFVEVGDLF